jgi:hypothetical protein
VSSHKADFTLGRAERGAPPAAVDVDRVVEGVEPETTKTFRLPVRLSRALKIHAAQTGQTEKEILTRLIAEYLADKG